MDIRTFVICQYIWYAGATIIAFAAALLFWKKGEAVVAGNIPLGVKLGGASAIFVAVVLVFHYVNPIIKLADSQKLLVLMGTITPTSATVKEKTPSEYVVDSGKITEMKVPYKWEDMAVEMVPRDQVYSLYLRLEDSAFATTEPIPKGRYLIRFIDTTTKQQKTFSLTVP